MSNIFKDGTDIYTDSTWDSSEWVNYIRLPDDNLKITSEFPDDEVGFNLWITEPSMVDKKLKIFATQASTDVLGRWSLYDSDDTELARSVDTNSLDSSAPSCPAFRTDTGYSWVAPGIAFRFSGNVHPANTFTDDRNVTVTIQASNIPEKRFDGGLHSWIKIDTASAGIATTQYSKTFGGEYLHANDSLLVFNSLSNKHSFTAGSNIALTLLLQGSVDGADDTWDSLGTILDDVNIYDEATPGMSSTLQLPYMMVGTEYPRYPYYRFAWYVKDGTGSERMPAKQNFVKLSIYKL